MEAKNILLQFTSGDSSCLPLVWLLEQEPLYRKHNCIINDPDIFKGNLQLYLFPSDYHIFYQIYA